METGKEPRCSDSTRHGVPTVPKRTSQAHALLLEGINGRTSKNAQGS